MRCDVTTALKELNLHGMTNAWTELTAKEEGETKIAPSRWLIEHLLKAEHTDRAMRSVSYQIKAALVRKKNAGPPLALAYFFRQSYPYPTLTPHAQKLACPNRS